MRSKRGSFTVFVMVIAVSLVSMILIFVKVTKDSAIKGAASGLGLLWCESILSEYDLNLYERYGIFAFRGIEPEINGKVAFYAEETIGEKDGIALTGARTDLSDYSLMDPDNVREQVVETAKLLIAGDFIEKDRKSKSYGEKQPVERNKAALMSGLPSAGAGGSVGIEKLKDLFGGAESFKALIKKTGDRYFECVYAAHLFKDMSDDKGLGETFFDNELEYVISGKSSDEDNMDAVKRRIVAMRLINNTIFAMKDPGINQETLAVAEFMTPGPAAIATQKILQAGWALAESYNDYKLLVHGKKVPMFKDSMSWALDLESIIRQGIRKLPEGDEPDTKKDVLMVDPGNTEGDEYQDYLRFMLSLMNEKLLLLRMMDVMEMNMRYSHYSDFRMRDYSTGLTLVIGVNDNEIRVRKSYMR